VHPLELETLSRDRMDELGREAARSRLAHSARRLPGPGAVARSQVGRSPHPAAAPSAPAARRQLFTETLAISLSVVGFGIVYGMTARAAGFSLLDLEAMNLLVFAGGSQFLAIGLLAAGLPWLWIVAITAVLNARHLLYGTSLAPWFGGRPRFQKALAAYVVVDESFALSMAHFRRLGRFDALGYVLVAGMLITGWLASTWLGWASATAVPSGFEAVLRVVVPAAIAGMAVLLVTDRSTLVAAMAAVVAGIATASFLGPAAGIVAGALLGVLAASFVAFRWPSHVRIVDGPVTRPGNDGGSRPASPITTVGQT